VLIKACLNGNRERGAHAGLPIAPQELARAARGAVDAGAGALHFHPRRADGTETLDTRDVAMAIVAINARCPGIPVGVTTRDAIEPDPAQRLALVRGWTVRPNFASVNFSEAGTADLCAALLRARIGVEAGLSTPADAQLLLTLGIAGHCVRLLIEPEEQTLEAALATVTQIETLLDAAGVQTPRLLHGYDATAWPLLAVALQRGYDVRIGLEDTLMLPDGSRASDNAELVAAARARAVQAGRWR
jgi:uncharacterized protein (DUF849 family)